MQIQRLAKFIVAYVAIDKIPQLSAEGTRILFL